MYVLVRVRVCRRLVVQPKGHDEAAAAAALASVSALTRPTELRGRRGRLYQVTLCARVASLTLYS